MELVKGVPITKYCDAAAPADPRAAGAVRRRSARRSSTPTRRASSTATSSRPTCWSRMQDGKPVPKVIDFGVAKAIAPAADRARRCTRELGQIVGTLEYMSPEQAELSGLDIDTRARHLRAGRPALRAADRHARRSTRKRLHRRRSPRCCGMIKEEEPPKPSTRLTSRSESLARSRPCSGGPSRRS